MKQSAQKLLAAGLCLYTLTGCQALDDLILPPSEAEKLDRQIELERKKQELERLKQAGQPTPAPTARSTPTPSSGPVNAPPQIQVLDAVLATTARNNDTVRLIVKASDADGDSLEYNWSSVYNGLSSTKGDSVVWFPGNQDLKGKTNIITVSVTDKKGGSSTASLNIFVQNDGTLLVREDTAAKPVLASLIATRTDDGRILLRASATDPAGGLLKYQWSSSAGQLTTPEAASTIWQAGGNESGEIALGLKVTNSAGLQSEGSFKFSRAADGSLSGGFTGTDVSLPTSGAILPGNTQGDAAIQLVGQLLVRQDDAIFRFDPRTRTKTQLVNLRTLAPQPGASIVARLLYAPPAAEADLLVNVPAATLMAQNQTVHYALNLTTGATRQVETLSYQTRQPMPVTLGGLALTLEPALSNTHYFLSQGQVKGIFSLYAPGKSTASVGSFDGQNLGVELPAGIRVEAVSHQGRILASRNQDELVLLDAATGSEQSLAKFPNQGLAQASSFVWNHKGDKIAFLSQGYAAGGQSGGSTVYTVDLSGQVKQQLDAAKQQDRRDLSWSLDDLYLGFAEYPYVYLQSPSDRRPRAGEYYLIELDKSGNRVSTHLATSDGYESKVDWIP